MYDEISHRVTLILLVTYTCIPCKKYRKKQVECQLTDTGQVYLVMACRYKLNMKDLDLLLVVLAIDNYLEAIDTKTYNDVDSNT